MHTKHRAACSKRQTDVHIPFLACPFPFLAPGVSEAGSPCPSEAAPGPGGNRPLQVRGLTLQPRRDSHCHWRARGPGTDDGSRAGGRGSRIQVSRAKAMANAAHRRPPLAGLPKETSRGSGGVREGLDCVSSPLHQTPTSAPELRGAAWPQTGGWGHGGTGRKQRQARAARARTPAPPCPPAPALPSL